MLAKAVQQKRAALLLMASQRNFRNDFQNPYKVAQIKVTDDIREQQKDLPVWERTFDHSKYMQRQGPLKQTTGVGFLDVEPFPRLKLMKLYYLALEEAKHLPDIYGYKTLSIELTKFRMKIVDENENTRDIEEKIGFGMVEELILAAHNELRLLRIMREWAPWDLIYNDEHSLEHQADLAYATPDHMFSGRHDDISADRNLKPERARTAGLHEHK